MAKGHELLNRYDRLLKEEPDTDKRMALKTAANQEIADMAKKAALDTLDKVLYELSNQMKNGYARSDA